MCDEIIKKKQLCKFYLCHFISSYGACASA